MRGYQDEVDVGLVGHLPDGEGSPRRDLDPRPDADLLVDEPAYIAEVTLGLEPVPLGQPRHHGQILRRWRQTPRHLGLRDDVREDHLGAMRARERRGERQDALRTR